MERFLFHKTPASLVTVKVLEVELTWLDYSHFPMETTVLVFNKHITKMMTSQHLYGPFRDRTDFSMHLSLEEQLTNPAGIMQVERPHRDVQKELNLNCKSNLYSSIVLLQGCFIFIFDLQETESANAL